MTINVLFCFYYIQVNSSDKPCDIIIIGSIVPSEMVYPTQTQMMSERNETVTYTMTGLKPYKTYAVVLSVINLSGDIENEDNITISELHVM